MKKWRNSQRLNRKQGDLRKYKEKKRELRQKMFCGSLNYMPLFYVFVDEKVN